jgi:hypothetical protein
MVTKMSCSYIRAREIASTYSDLYNRSYNKLLETSYTGFKPTVAICVPNYNNEYILPEAIDGLLSQRGLNIEVYIMDNCSIDKSWEIIQSYKRKHSNIHAIRHRSNLGSSANINMLMRSTYQEYTLLASGNDVLNSKNDLVNMLRFMNMNSGVDLVYGRNIRQGQYVEPSEYCFSVPTLEDRRHNNISSYDCMDTVTWMYTSNEPLWGLYRSSAIKMAPLCNGYGADHVLVTSIAASGGIAGLDMPFRCVDIERRDNMELRDFQDPSMYTNNDAISSHAINKANIIQLCRSYFDGLSTVVGTEKLDALEAVHRSLETLVKRFPLQLLMELSFIQAHARCSVPDDNTLKMFDPLRQCYNMRDSAFLESVLIPYIKAILRNHYNWAF